MQKAGTKKLLSVILCAALCMGSVPVYASSPEGSGTAQTAAPTEIAPEEEPAPAGPAQEDTEASGEETVIKDASPENGQKGQEVQEESREEEEPTNKSTPEEEPCRVKMLNSVTGDEIPEDIITFSSPASYEDGYFVFYENSVGDEVEYTVTGQGGGMSSGTFTLGKYDLTVHAEVINRIPIGEEEAGIEKTYGDRDFRIADYVAIPEDYTGKASYKVESGSETAAVDDSGSVHILGAGEAVIVMDLPAAGNYEEASVAVHVTVSKYDMGTINTEEVTWDSLEVEYSQEGLYTLTGKLPGVTGDEIGVTAVVKPEKNTVGKHAAAVTSFSFDRDQDYEASLSEKGPEITVTAKKKRGLLRANSSAVKASYNEGDALNGMYFSGDRELTLVVSAEDYNEDLLLFEAEVDGNAVSLDSLRTGTDGAWIITDAEKDAEAGTVTYRFGFGGNGTDAEHSYKVNISYDGVDAAFEGDAPTEFVVDSIAPKLSVAFTNSKGAQAVPGTDPENPYYDIGAVTATVTVEEKNFSANGAAFTVTAKDSEGKDISGTAYPEANTHTTEEDWQADGNIHTFAMVPYEKDAAYSLAAGFTDLAGNAAQPLEARYFTVDATPPEGKIVVKTFDGKEKEYERVLTDKELSEGLIDYVFDTFSKKVTLESNAEDKTSGVASVQYCLVDVDSKAEADFQQPAQLEGLDWQDYKEGITIETDRIAVIFEKITDKAGHITYVSSKGGIIVDTKEPDAPEVTIEAAAGTSYRADFNVKLSASDPDNGGEGIFSGMKTISYQVVNETTGEVTLEGGKDAEKARQRDIECEITVPVSGNQSNAVTLTVTAEDYAGNKTTEKRTFSCDSAAPVISIDFDDSGVSNDRYFNSTREVKVTFEERNFRAGRSKIMFRTGNENVSLSMEQLVKGQGTAYGVSVKEMSDTQDSLIWIDRTDARKITYTLLIGDGPGIDREYAGLRFTSEDEAGNKAEKAEEKYTAFTVDKVAPVLSVAYHTGTQDITDKIGTNKDVPYYTRGSITPSLTVTERNFWEKGVTAQVSQKDSAGDDIDAYPKASIDALHEKSWEKSGNTNSFTMDAFSGDGNYGLSFIVTDLAGNRAQGYAARYYTIDNTPPTGKLIVTSGDGRGEYTGFSGTVSFQYMDNAPVAVANEADDETSGVASVAYYRHVPPVFARGWFAGLSLEKLRDVKWTEWNSDLTVSPDSQAIIYARIMDRAGNVIYINTEGGIIADSTDPSAPEISINIAEPSGGIFNRDVPVTVSTRDPVSGDTFSGLKNVSVEVLRDGSVTQSDGGSFGPKEDRRQDWSADLTIDAEKNNSNNVLVRVTAEDYAGNVVGAERALKIDVTAPRIEVTYDNNDPKNGMYYDSPRTATVTVYERNFDPSGVDFNISGSPRISGWSIGGQAGSSDDNPNTCTIVYDGDAEYSFTMSVTDEAGNSADYGQTDRFVVDRTAPVISVSFDNNSAQNGRYYNRPRTAYITVTDLSFDADLFDAAISASLGGNGIGAPSISGWTHSGNDHRASVTFDSDGDYNFTFDCTDLAGNRGQQVSEGLFTIDLTPPAITFFDVEDGSANSGEAAPGIRFEDLNIGDNIVSLVLAGYRHPAREVTGLLEKLENGGTVKLEDIEHTITEDDVYTLTATVTDLAGNTTTKTLTFSVNRFGSTYYFSDMTAEYIDRYYNKNGGSVVIYEVNVDEVKDNTITVYRDGKVLEVPEGKSKIEDISEENNWRQYMYSIDASVFEEEGAYEVIVGSADKAGNRQDNKSAGVPANFIVDRTAPTAVITGVENDGYYDEKSRDAVISVTDDRAMGTLKVFVNGEERASFDAEEIAKAEGKLPLTLSESDSWQEITLQFEDAAGNAGEAAPCRVLITTNAMTKFIRSRTWLWLLLLMLAAGTGYAVVRKKRNG